MPVLNHAVNNAELVGKACKVLHHKGKRIQVEMTPPVTLRDGITVHLLWVDDNAIESSALRLLVEEMKEV